MHTEFWLGNLMEIVHFQVQEGNGEITLKMHLGKIGCEMDGSSSESYPVAGNLQILLP